MGNGKLTKLNNKGQYYLQLNQDQEIYSYVMNARVLKKKSPTSPAKSHNNKSKSKSKSK